jgi:HD-like signal output (HDOD) protein
LNRFCEVKILDPIVDTRAMEMKDSLALLDLELKKAAALGGNMAVVVVPEAHAETAIRAKREMDTAVRFGEYLVIGVLGMEADAASAQFLSIPKGISVFPKDGNNAQSLFFGALERFNLSRGNSPWVKSLWESLKNIKVSEKAMDPEGRLLSSTFYQFYAFLEAHPEELGTITGQFAQADKHWIEDILPFGVVSMFRKDGAPQDIQDIDVSRVLEEWGYQEKMEAKQELGKATLRRFRNVEHLFTLPSISQEIIALAGDDMVAASKMARIIEKDPVLTSRLLKVVNSAFYGFRRQINSVEHAVVILGNDEVVNLAFSIAVHQIMDKLAPRQAHILWEHSLMVAHLSHWLGPILGCDGGGMLYTLGLLHDFGKIIFLQRGYLPGDLSVLSTLEDLAGEERETGVSHAEMGAFVAERWNLPEDIVDGLQFHHQPAKAMDLSLAATVHIADIVAHRGGIDTMAVNTAVSRYLSKRSPTNLTEGLVKEKVEAMQQRVKTLLDM